MVTACGAVLLLIALATALVWRDSVILAATPGAGSATNTAGGGTMASIDTGLGGTVDASTATVVDAAGAGTEVGAGQSVGAGGLTTAGGQATGTSQTILTSQPTTSSPTTGAGGATTGTGQTTGTFQTTGTAVGSGTSGGGQTNVVSQPVSYQGTGGSPSGGAGGQGGNGQGGNGQGGGSPQPGEGTTTPELPSAILMLLGLIPLLGAGFLLRRRRGALDAG